MRIQVRKQAEVSISGISKKGRRTGKACTPIRIRIFIKAFGKTGRSMAKELMCIIQRGLNWRGYGMKDRFSMANGYSRMAIVIRGSSSLISQ